MLKPPITAFEPYEFSRTSRLRAQREIILKAEPSRIKPKRVGSSKSRGPSQSLASMLATIPPGVDQKTREMLLKIIKERMKV